jgi:cytoskeletal protein CcmA (bactofilin family)
MRPETRPASQPSSFRPAASPINSPMGGDMGRNRMPESKPAPTSSMGMSMNVDKTTNKNGGRRVLTVGNDILLKGEIATCDRLVIEGKVDATLNDVHTVEISETGSFKGSAHIEDAEISGLFEGDLVVRNRLVIYATGKVRGKITYGEIEIERGGELTGEIKTNAQAGTSSLGAPASRPATRKDEKMVAA